MLHALEVALPFLVVGETGRRFLPQSGDEAANGIGNRVAQRGNARRRKGAWQLVLADVHVFEDGWQDNVA